MMTIEVEYLGSSYEVRGYVVRQEADIPCGIPESWEFDAEHIEKYDEDRDEMVPIDPKSGEGVTIVELIENETKYQRQVANYLDRKNDV